MIQLFLNQCNALLKMAINFINIKNNNYLAEFGINFSIR